jgi:NADPH2:quinone reductase
MIKSIYEREIVMKAVLCKEFGPPETLVVEDIPSPQSK